MALPYTFVNGELANADEVNANFEYLNDGGSTKGLLFENSLDILELQANASLDLTESSYMVRDLYTQNTGLLSTINTTNTDALFSSLNKTYQNGFDPQSIIINNVVNGVTDYTINCISFQKGYVSEVRMSVTGAATGTVTIAQNSVTLATKSQAVSSAGNLFSFATTDYSSMIDPAITSGAFTIRLQVNANQIQRGGSGSFIGELMRFDGTSQQAPRSGDNNLASIKYEVDPTLNFQDYEVETNKLDINITPDRFQIYTKNKTTTGGSSITYDVSFDNGTNWQTNLNDDEQIVITNSGTELIIKQKLNGGVSDEKATASGYALMFWNT